MNKQIVVFGLSVVVSGVLFLHAYVKQPAPAAPLPDKIDYNWDVKPILSDNCFRCHGPDAKARQAGLRLDVADVAYGVISRGKPDESILVDRITSKDPG